MLLKTPPVSLYTPRFFLLCMSSTFFFTSFNMLLPELPGYLENLGGAEYKGLIISLFTLTAGISRPFSGKLTDTIGRKPVMLFGILVCCICSISYPLLNTVLAFLLLRLVHGFSTGFTPTATSAYMADIIPEERRGEAMGMLGLTNNVGTAFGVVLGSIIVEAVSTDMLFYASSLVAFIALILLLQLKETLPQTAGFRWQLLRIGRNEIFEPRVFPPALVMVFTVFSLGSILTIIPDYSDYLGISNKGFFLAVYTLSSILVRFGAGKLSDQIGRILVMKVACVFLFAGLLVLSFSDSYPLFFLAAVLLGLGIGTISPTSFAWTIDLALPSQVGKAVATLYIALEVGIGMGALTSGLLYKDDPADFPAVFLVGAGLVFLAFVFLFWQKEPMKN